MNYGVVVSEDSFAFTRYGVISLSQLPADSEILGVSGIGKHTQFRKVSLCNGKKSTKGLRIITQTTDSILVHHTNVFSERVRKAENLCSINEIEFYNPSESPRFKPGLKGETVDLQPEVAYGIGLLTDIVYKNSRCVAFLIRNVVPPKYTKYVKQNITNLADSINTKTKARFVEGKLGHLWVIFKGDAVKKIQSIMADFSMEKICMKLSSAQLANCIAGMLDCHINKPLYGGDPVLAFLIKDSGVKRFLQNILILHDSQVVETSCITSHDPKFLESTAIITRKIPVKNPTWNDISESSEAPRLFSKIRGWLEIQTFSTNLLFEEEGFSPIIDGLYTYPSTIPN